MMYSKCVLLTIMVILSPLIKTQPGGGGIGPGDTTDTSTSTLCDIDGGDSTYSETINDDIREITASGCPNHYSECTGKEGVCVEGETEATVYDKSIQIPAYPCFNDYVDTSDYEWEGFPVYCLLDSLGIALNGVSLFSPSANTECKDAIGEESESFDTCGGHAGPTGLYHYHAGPACLLDQLDDAVETNPAGHSPQVGWAYDGFPVYGPHGEDGEYILLCSQDGANPDDCLDNCSGHRHEKDGFKYHYHIAGPVGDLTSSPLNPLPDTERWPYTFGCFRGIPADWNLIATNDIPDLTCTENGYTDDYVPQATPGVTDKYYYSAQDSNTDTDTSTSTTTTTSSSSGYIVVTISEEKDYWMELDLSNTNGITVRTVKIQSANYNSWTTHSASWTNYQGGQTFGFNVTPRMEAPFSIKMISNSGETITSYDVINKREEGASGTMTQAFGSGFTEEDGDNTSVTQTVWIAIAIFLVCVIGCIAVIYKKKCHNKSRKEVTFDHDNDATNVQI